VIGFLSALTLFASGLASAADLPKATFDRGGMTFDLEAISAARFPMKDGGLSGFCSRRTDADPATPVALSVDWKKFHADVPGRGIAFRYRYKCLKYGSFVKQYINLGYFGKDADGKRVSLGNWRVGGLRETGNAWATFYLTDAGVPGKGDTLEIGIDPDGGFSSLELKDVQPVGEIVTNDAEDGSKYRIAVRQDGMLCFDGRFVLGRGQAQEIDFGWKLNAGAWPKPPEGKKFSFRLDLPAGVKLISPTSVRGTVQSAALPDGGTRNEWTLDGDYAPRNDFNGWYRPAALVTSDLTAGSKPGRCVATALYEGEPVSKEVAVELVVEEPVRALAKPKRYVNGVCYRGPGTEYSPVGIAACADTLVEMGVTGVQGGRLPFVKAMKERGIGFRMAGTYFIANGYFINTCPPDPKKIPDGQRFVPDDSVRHPADYAYLPCPRAIYQKESYFREHVVPSAKRYFSTEASVATSWGSNWEPNTYFGHGCMCARCRQGFAAFAGLDEADVAKDWPACVRPGGRFHAKALRFRAVEHAKIVRTLQELALEILGKDSGGFVPLVAWPALAGGYPEVPLYAEVAAEDYAGDLAWIEPFGPYVWWDVTKPYFREKRFSVAGWSAARANRDYVDRLYKKPPKLLAYPHGQQGTGAVNQPEWLAQNLDCYFFNRWEASVVYFFPQGYDLRWWKRFAEASTRAGYYEDYVIDGTRSDASVVATPVPEYAVPCRQTTGYLSAATNVSPLCTAAYDLKGGRIVAALNFWEPGEAFFRLTCKDLPDGEYTVVQDRRTLVTRKGASVWTAAQLEKGLFLGVGAARTAVFEIRPAAEHAERKAVDRLDMTDFRELYEAARPRLKPLADRDREEEAGRSLLVVDGTPMI